ncbi:hypothetical protein KC19_7G046100 [Ceratodon purpureus]|uniref:Protein kinase domain-containing protein n=1 Tax=Ceratodon purpureus TaxID=3225 RepID=A0A8T0H282_CERPU|nr:hypothetical protein KC19_7G046100 [Ceratodon purpureus]
MATKFFPSRQNWTFKFWTPKQHWTTIIDSSTSESKDVIEDFKHVPRFGKHKVQLLKQINEGAQGIIHTAQVSVHNNHLNEDEQIPIECVVKAFKGSRSYGQWPEEVFELSKLSQYICKFLGYCKDGDTFYLIMQRYDCSLRGAIDKVMMKRKGVAVFRVAFAIFYFLLVFYAPKILWHFDYISASALARVVSGWYFLPVYVILLLGGVAIIRLVFLSLIVYYYARPLADSTVLIMMIQIALGMQILHEKGIVHRDLKADNILVQYKHGQLIAAFIGDFDVGSKLVGTQFWRAPEILEALDKGEKMHHIQFNSTADVYSYAMTCYEILTGAIPLEGLRSSDYDAVISGKRPKLPTDLNPKLKSLIQRCWHQESAMRPTFCDIVTELEELVKELVTGSLDMSKMFNDMFDHAKIALDVERASAESSLVELKELLQVLVLKYDQADFLLLGLEVVAAMEEFQCRFGLRCFKEQHDLAYSEWFARR